MVIYQGEVGIGKTRLIKELKKYALSREFTVLEGACVHQEFSDPYLPFINASRCLVHLSIVIPRSSSNMVT